MVDKAGRPAGRRQISVHGCPAKRVESGVYEINGEATCDVWASRRDGALWARSERVRVLVTPGDEAYAQVVLRNERTGGLGVSIGHAPNGIKVLKVMPGTPAAEAGLAAGDVITEVNGLPTQGMGMQSFIQTMTGPVGTEVDFVLAFEDEEGKVEEQLSIVRSFLDKS